MIQYYILSKLVSDEKEYLRIAQQLTGPRLTTASRLKMEAERPKNEPAMPSWWDEDDEEISNDNLAAASALGMNVAIT